VGQIPLSPLARVPLSHPPTEFGVCGESDESQVGGDDVGGGKEMLAAKLSLKKSKMKVHRILCKKKTKYDGK